MSKRDMEFGLILANDITEPLKAKKLSKVVAPYLDGIKIGITTTLEKGISIIKEIKKSTEIPILADFKLADIGFFNKNTRTWEGTNGKIVANLADAGVDYVICHTIVGTSSIQECVEVAHQKGTKILTLPFMTHVGADLFFSHPVNYEHITIILEKTGIDVPENKIKLCKTIMDVILTLGNIVGVDGYIGPANNTSILKRYRELTNKPIFAPGIGRQAKENTSPKDQLRQFYEVTGKNSAAIIGSAIYLASDPLSATKEFLQWRNQVVGELTMNS